MSEDKQQNTDANVQDSQQKDAAQEKENNLKEQLQKEEPQVQNEEPQPMEDVNSEGAKPADKPPVDAVQVDPKTFFNMQLIQYDHDIAQAELAVAEKKAQKQAFILDYNVSQVRAQQKQPKAAEADDKSPELYQK